MEVVGEASNGGEILACIGAVSAHCYRRNHGPAEGLHGVCNEKRRGFRSRGQAERCGPASILVNQFPPSLPLIDSPSRTLHGCDLDGGSSQTTSATASTADSNCCASAGQADAGRNLGEKQVLEFITVLRERFMGKDRIFSGKYLKLLVEEIRFENKQLMTKGSYAAVAKMVGESLEGTAGGGVPCFGLDWLPGQDSNLRPAG
jgi:hypothetical protein